MLKKIVNYLRYSTLSNSYFLRPLGLKLVPYYFLPLTGEVFRKFETMNFLVSSINKRNISGEIVECGFGFGRSFSILSYLAVKSKRKLFEFDSFSGFPSIHALDHSDRKAKTGEWNVRNLKESIEFTESLDYLSNQDYTMNKIIFNEYAINPIPNTKIALLHIDLDLFEGYKYSLELFWDQVSIGGIVIFDEFDEPKWPGATVAIHDFLTTRGITLDSLSTFNGKTYIIK